VYIPVLNIGECCAAVQQREESPLIEPIEPGQLEAAVAAFPDEHSVVSRPVPTCCACYT